MPLVSWILTDRLSLTTLLFDILQSPYHMEGIQLSLSHTLSISQNYPMAIIHRPIIIYKGCYITVIAPTNRDS